MHFFLNVLSTSPKSSSLNLTPLAVLTKRDSTAVAETWRLSGCTTNGVSPGLSPRHRLQKPDWLQVLNLLRSTLDTAEIQRNITTVFHILRDAELRMGGGGVW